MKVRVKWLKSPRVKYKIPRAPGTFSVIDEDLAKKIEKESPGFLQILEKEKPPVVRTRPVKRAKED
jgi:hypothetical protein